MQLSDLLEKSSSELLEHAKELRVENALAMRERELTIAIIGKLREQGQTVSVEGVLDVIPGPEFGFLRLEHSQYAPGPYDIYVSPTQVTKFKLRTGDIVSGEIRAPKKKEAYCALLKVSAVNFENPAKACERSEQAHAVMPVSQDRVVEMLGL